MSPEAKNLILRMEVTKRAQLTSNQLLLHELNPKNQVLCLSAHLARVFQKKNQVFFMSFRLKALDLGLANAASAFIVFC